MKKKILLVDDNISFTNDVESLLEGRYSIVKAHNGKRALEVLKIDHVDVILLDLDLPDISGLEVLKVIKKDIDQYIPVIIVTDYGDLSNVVETIKYGAYDFVQKDFTVEYLSAKITKALEHRDLELHVNLLQDTFKDKQNVFIAESDKMKGIQQEISRLANLPYDVLINGETGVGKDRIAYEIHRRGQHSDKPFIPISLRSLNEQLIESELFGHEKGAFSGADSMKIGKLEAANGGTIYIPEVSSLTESLQLKLLHFMQYKSLSRVGHDPRKPEIKVDLRIIMATNEDLKDVVLRGKMREDFYYRISGVMLQVPPLRQRTMDILPMVRYFLQLYAAPNSAIVFDIPREVQLYLEEYSWPGNVRELENSVKNALAYTRDNKLTKDLFPLRNRAFFDQVQKIDDDNAQNNAVLTYKDADMIFKQKYFKNLLKACEGNISNAAKRAGITRQGLHKILNGLKMD
jgi:DNA-binding NtrC family response regulator